MFDSRLMAGQRILVTGGGLQSNHARLTAAADVYGLGAIL